MVSIALMRARGTNLRRRIEPFGIAIYDELVRVADRDDGRIALCARFVSELQHYAAAAKKANCARASAPIHGRAGAAWIVGKNFQNFQFERGRSLGFDRAAERCATEPITWPERSPKRRGCSPT